MHLFQCVFITICVFIVRMAIFFVSLFKSSDREVHVLNSCIIIFFIRVFQTHLTNTMKEIVIY